MSADSSKMSDLHRCGPASERIHTDAGPLFETDLVGLPAAGSEPLRDCGRTLGRMFERFGFYRLESAGLLEGAVEALRRDASRLEAFVVRVTAGADAGDGLTEVLRGSGFLLRRIVREIEEGRQRLEPFAPQEDFQDV